VVHWACAGQKQFRAMIRRWLSKGESRGRHWWVAHVVHLGLLVSEVLVIDALGFVGRL